MKKILLLFLLTFLWSCNSDYDFELGERQSGVKYTQDDEGDPVIENADTPEQRELFTFGAEGGFCYGYSTPEAEVAVIDIDIDFPEAYDLSEYLPEVRSQGKQGSCVAWAAGYYLKSFQENYEDSQNGILTNGNEMSPAFIYNQIKTAGCDGGSVLQRALDTIVSQGIIEWAQMPYNENECSTQPEDFQITLAGVNKIENYFYLDTVSILEQTKAALLNQQPVVIAVTVDRSYFGARDANGQYVYRKYKEGVGGHAMLVVGYNDQMNAFKVVNSWGKNWGNDGFLWIDYKAWEQAGDTEGDFGILCEAWITNDVVITLPDAP
ncbi:C1 family peptidase [Lutimonas zeaxanthinifaciens]|uniref:C1 family peptidase n=1 Tax=Lutimonas zeaxanthinifaciens TaxID=3060215 RepID=UPI00265D5571|nr:C1 family peptidase [Lutimonas sp. YSD2104]WKK65506.1 C1 family peptidase [Lutimonas sp. YSD2104]